MSVETSLRADLAACEGTVADLGAMADALDSTVGTTRRVLDGSGAWCLAYEDDVAGVGDRAAEEAADVRGVAAALGTFAHGLRQVDGVLGRARTAATSLSLLDGTVVVEPQSTADEAAWAGYGRIVRLVTEARGHQAEVEAAWVEALWRYDAGWSPAQKPSANLLTSPLYRPPAIGAFPGEDVAPTPTEPTGPPTHPPTHPSTHQPTHPHPRHHPDPPRPDPEPASPHGPSPSLAATPEPARTPHRCAPVPQPAPHPAAQTAAQPVPASWFDVLAGHAPAAPNGPPEVVPAADPWLTEPSPAPGLPPGLLAIATVSETPPTAG